MRSASLAVMKAVISVDNIERSECGLRTSGQPSQNRPLTSLGIPRRKSPTLDVATSAQVLLFVVPFLCLRRRARRGPWMQGKCASTSSGSRKKKVRSLAPNGISQVTASSSAGAHETYDRARVAARQVHVDRLTGMHAQGLARHCLKLFSCLLASRYVGTFTSQLLALILFDRHHVWRSAVRRLLRLLRWIRIRANRDEIASIPNVTHL